MDGTLSSRVPKGEASDFHFFYGNKLLTKESQCMKQMTLI